MNDSRSRVGQKKVSDSIVPEEAERALAAILESGQVTELRALGVSTSNYKYPHVVSGYFNNLEAMVEAAASIPNAKGIYFIPNSINPALLARAVNRVRPVEKESLTCDADVLTRRWLLIDVDPVRPSGISSSAMEHEAALARLREIRDALAKMGWPAPILADSGNGGHGLYRIELPTDDGGLVKHALEALAFQFDAGEVTVDIKVFNPARIWKLYGTVARKGDNTVDRPHRVAKLLEVPGNLTVVPKRLLEIVAALSPLSASRKQRPTTTGCGTFDLDRWIAMHGLEVEGPEPWQGGRRWIFQVCPWNSNHRNRSAYIVQLESGVISAGCHHSSCNGRGWKDLRYLFEHESRDWLNSADSFRARFASKTPEDNGTEGLQSNKPEVTVPGEHDGLRFGHDQLALAMRDHLPLGVTLFRRGTEFVRLVGQPGRLCFHPLSPDSLRGLVDQHADLIKIKANRNSESIKEYRPCSRDLAGTLLAALSCDPAVPECETITAFPAWVRTRSGDWKLPRPGFDFDARHFFDAPPEMLDFSPRILDPDNPTDRKLVYDNLAPDEHGPFQHFPWANRASAVNVLAAELTILMRPGIRSPVPIIVLTAPLPRCGKGLLVDGIHRIATGEEVCVHALPQNEEEMSKVLLSSLRKGAQVILFDNAKPGQPICSGTLAAFVTSTEFGGRVLGHSKDVSYPNRTVLFLTGNNLALSRELALRALPIELMPANANPEARDGLPSLPETIARDRPWLLALFHGMIQAWVLKGTPPGHVEGLGGFEEWASVVGGVLKVWGLAEELGGNLPMWRAETDTETGDVERFLIVWRRGDGGKRDWSIRELLALAQHHDLFPEVFDRKEHGRLVAFSKSVVKPLVDVARELPDEEGNRRKFRVIQKGSATSHRRFRYRLDVK